jgi:hypothetical protein
MKVSVEYDGEGNILAVIAHVPATGEAAHTVLEAGPGYNVAEFDAPGVKDYKDYDNLQKFRQEHRVELKHGGHRLVPKSTAG